MLGCSLARRRSLYGYIVSQLLFGLSDAQRVAIEHHCRLAIETMHPRFRSIVDGYSRILTVTSGYE